MDIIMTGVTGFVGKNLSSYLRERGNQIFNLSLRESWTLEKEVNSIIHLAAIAHDTSNTFSADEYFKVNRDLTIELFKEFLNSDIQDFFYFSSVKAVADTVDGVLIEEVIPNAITPYGKSKMEAEEYLLKQKLPEGKRLFIIRPCMIHGPGNKGNLNLLYKFVERGIPYPLAAFENQRSFLSIDNLNFMILEILKNKEIASGVYNFADDDSISTNDLVTLIAKSIGKKENLWKINSKIIIKFAKIGDYLKLPLNSERLKKLTESYVVSNQKIKKVLKIEKLPVSVEQGLEKTIKSFKK